MFFGFAVIPPLIYVDCFKAILERFFGFYWLRYGKIGFVAVRAKEVGF